MIIFCISETSDEAIEIARGWALDKKYGSEEIKIKRNDFTTYIWLNEGFEIR